MVVVVHVLVDCSIDGSTRTQTGLALRLGDAPVPRYSSFDQPPQHHSLGFSFELTWKCCVDLFCRELASKVHNLDPTPEAMGAISNEGEMVRQHPNLEPRPRRRQLTRLLPPPRPSWRRPGASRSGRHRPSREKCPSHRPNSRGPACRRRCRRASWRRAKGPGSSV